jgi:hypothetical protein
MGKGAYFRIINKSTLAVAVTIEDSTEIGDHGIKEMQGNIAPGSQLPAAGGTPVQGNGSYQYMEGEKKTILQKDGHFKFSVTAEGCSTPALTTLCVDASDWWCAENKVRDEVPVARDATQASLVALATTVEEVGEQYKIDVAIYNAFNPKSWMSELASEIGTTPLCQVCLPGTHDSATYEFEEELGASPDSDLTMSIQRSLTDGDDDDGDGAKKKGMFAKMANSIGSAINTATLGVVFDRMCKAQSLSIKKQLEAGIRYLDLRVAYHEDSDKYYSCHGVYCVKMTTVIDEVNTFLTENPKEIVILDLNHLYKMDGHHERFVSETLATLGDKVADSKTHQLGPTSAVGKFWEHKAQAVILYQNTPSIALGDGKLWPQSMIRSPWPETNNLEVLRTKLKENVKSRKTDSFFVLQGLLTPDGDLIKEEIMQNNVSTSLASIAKRASPKVVEWIEEWKGEQHNIVIVDFFHECFMVPLVINLNRK